jgi:hypothetical protein
MHGQLLSVWSDTWDEIWEPLIYSEENVPIDIACELYRGVAEAFAHPLAPELLADVIDDANQAMEAFRSVSADQFAGERRLVKFFEDAHEILEDIDADGLPDRYVNLLSAFLRKYNSRYDLRRPCVLCPTIPGLFSSVMHDLRDSASRDPHVGALLQDFEESVRDLRQEPSSRRVKTSIQKQFNLLEALAGGCSGVSAKELGAMCREINSWPHPTVRNALSALYGFASDYPGIRHAGNPKAALREVDLRDLIAMTVLLAGFSPYLRDGFDANAVYFGA